MNITLSPALENFVKETVENGLYNNESEVMNEALRLLQVKEQKRKALFDALDKGFEDLEAGRYEEYTPELLHKITNDVIARNKK